MAATPTAADAVEPPRWPDLPLDLLVEISRRLHAADDYVRFHAVCRPWRDAFPPPPCRPAFLPWLLSPPDRNCQRKAAYCILSSKSSRRTTTMHIPYRKSVVSAEDGVAAFPLEFCLESKSSRSLRSSPLLASGSAGNHLPPYTSEIKSWLEEDDATGVVSGDGTILLYRFCWSGLNLALLRPGDATWTSVQKKDLHIYYAHSWELCGMAYRDDKIMLCHESSWMQMSMENEAKRGYHDQYNWTKIPDEPGMKFEASYMVESRGELLWVFVRTSTQSAYYKDVLNYHASDVDSLASALLVSVYTLREEEGREPLWLKRDSQSLGDRIFFLGRPRSFAVDSTQLGMNGGCAYFVKKGNLYTKIWSKFPLERCRLFRYSFHDDKSELVDQLPDDWENDYYMWIMPQPTIAPTDQGIKRRHGTIDQKTAGPQQQLYGPYFRIYVGNLPRKVDSYQLRQFFSKHGKVADARVMCNNRSGRSRGFGFVTMATLVDGEPPDAITKLKGQCLDGRPLRVKYADQETQMEGEPS